MKILQINSVCGIRSTGRICTDLAEVLEQNGHECKIAYGRETIPEIYRTSTVKIGSDIDIKIHALQSHIFDNAGFCSRTATNKFIEWVKNYNPDVIHLHNIHGYYINIEILFNYLAEANKPVIWTLHDCWAFTGHCAYYSYIKCDKWKKGCMNCPQKKRYPSSLVFDFSKKNWERKKNLFTSVKKMTLVTPSRWLANQVEQSFLSNYPIKVIPNGIDLNVFKPTPSNFRKAHNLEGKKIILGVASAWGPRKGLDDFVKLSKILDDNYKIILVGLTEKQKKELPKNILGITRTNNVRELIEIYTAAYVLFNPTYEDNYPTVNLEAQACGTPVVTYRTGGSIESVPCQNIVENFKALPDILSAKIDIKKDLTMNKSVLFNLYLDVYKQTVRSIK